MQYSWSLLLISIFVYTISIFVAKPQVTYFSPQRNNIRKGSKLFFCLLIINSVFAFWEYDTYHYWNGFIIANQYKNFSIESYEAIYNWLATISENNFFIWRALIWIPACLFMYYTAKRLDLLNRNFLVAMLLFGSFLSYTRGMLGHAMLVFGSVLLVDKKSTTFTQIIGVFIVALSYYFHKSMYVNIIFAILAFIPFGKKSINISLILFPFLTIVATYIVDNIASGVLDLSLADGVGGVGDRTIGYVSKEKTFRNANGILAIIIQFIPQYIALFYLYRKVMIENIFGKEKRNVYRYLFKLTYVAFYIASLFFFVNTSNWIYERFKYMGFFPMVFALGKVWSIEQKSSKTIRIIILLQGLSILWMLSYRLYKWYGL